MTTVTFAYAVAGLVPLLALLRATPHVPDAEYHLMEAHGHCMIEAPDDRT